MRYCLLMTMLLWLMPSPLAAQSIYFQSEGDGTLSFSDTPTQGYNRYKYESDNEYAVYDGKNIQSAITRYANQYDLDPHLLRAIIKTESNFDPEAVSRKGAKGLMQIMPMTARNLQLSDPFDPNENIRAGAHYLKSLLTDFNGDLRMALAAYNAGPTTVKKYGGVPPYNETIHYIEQVMMYYKQLKTVS